MSGQQQHTEERPAVAPGRKNRRALWAAVIGLLLVAVAGWLLAHNMGKPLTQAQQGNLPQAPPLVASPRTPPPLAPPVTAGRDLPSQPGPQKVQVPPDVLRYLEHLKRVEAYRQAMRNDVNPAIQMLKDAYAVEFGLGNVDDEADQKRLGSGYSKYIQDWQKLIRYFQALPAPQDCAQLGATYGAALDSYVLVMSNIQIAMSRGDLSALMNMRSGAQRNVDRQLKESDRLLEEVTRKYDLRKEFDITTDSDVGSLLGL